MPDLLLNTLAVTEKTTMELSRTRSVKIVMPFVTLAGVGILLEWVQQSSPKKPFCVKLLTRFDAESILAGACDLEALRALLDCRNLSTVVEVKRLDNLHAKCFIFDERSLIVGSSNMTLAGQVGNIELGSFSSSRASVQSALSEFDYYWRAAMPIGMQWIDEQHTILEPFLKRYQALRSEMRGLMVLQSIRMPSVEDNFLASLKIVLRKAGSAKGMRKEWLEEGMLQARRNMTAEDDADPNRDEPKLNAGKRVIFLEILGLVHEANGSVSLTAFGRECASDEKLLLKKMVATFPILAKSYEAISGSRRHNFKDIAHVDPDPRKPTDPSQTLRNAIHWLMAFGLLHEEKVGSTYYFWRRKSVHATLLARPLE